MGIQIWTRTFGLVLVLVHVTLQHVIDKPIQKWSCALIILDLSTVLHSVNSNT